MTREARIWEAFNNGELEQDTAGLMLQDTEMVYKAIEREYITPEFGAELLALPTYDEYMEAKHTA